MAQWRAVIAILCLLLAGGSSQALADTVNVALDTPSLDLLPHLQAVATDQPTVSIEVPGTAPGQKILLPLEAKGLGPDYRWIVANLGNPASVAQDVVMVVPHQGFVGSGVFWPLPQGSRILSLVSVGGAEPQRLVFERKLRGEVERCVIDRVVIDSVEARRLLERAAELQQIYGRFAKLATKDQTIEITPFELRW